MRSILIYLTFAVFLFAGTALFAQPLPYDMIMGGGEGSSPVGGGAALGNGVAMLVMLAAGYGVFKYRQGKKKLMD